METLVLMMDTAAVLVVVFFSLRNEARPDGTDEVGPFRLKPARKSAPATPAVDLSPRVKRRRTRFL